MDLFDIIRVAEDNKMSQIEELDAHMSSFDLPKIEYKRISDPTSTVRSNYKKLMGWLTDMEDEQAIGGYTGMFFCLPPEYRYAYRDIFDVLHCMYSEDDFNVRADVKSDIISFINN